MTTKLQAAKRLSATEVTAAPKIPNLKALCRRWENTVRDGDISSAEADKITMKAAKGMDPAKLERLEAFAAKTKAEWAAVIREAMGGERDSKSAFSKADLKLLSKFMGGNE